MNDDGTPRECVILLHGLGRTRRSMLRMQQALATAGYRVINLNYPSRQLPIADLAETAIDASLKKCHSQLCSRIHFVTHSLGGILVRQYQNRHDIPDMGRVVMLGPPNQGSEVVDSLRLLPLYRWLNGPAGLQLGTAADDLPKRLGPVAFELGVIAGKRSMNLILSRLLPGQNDGKVSVESTKVEGMSDFVTLPCTHTFMMSNPRAIRQTLHFLAHGHFDHAEG